VAIFWRVEMTIEQRIKEARKMNCDADLLVSIERKLNGIEDELDMAQFQTVLMVISDTREPFIEAKRRHADITKALVCLNKSRDLLKADDFYKAWRMAKKGEKIIKETIGGNGNGTR
jgi:uncharacterized protein with ATP-grasp and redox domains